MGTSGLHRNPDGHLVTLRVLGAGGQTSCLKPIARMDRCIFLVIVRTFVEEDQFLYRVNHRKVSPNA